MLQYQYFMNQKLNKPTDNKIYIYGLWMWWDPFHQGVQEEKKLLNWYEMYYRKELLKLSETGPRSMLWIYTSIYMYPADQYWDITVSHNLDLADVTGIGQLEEGHQRLYRPNTMIRIILQENNYFILWRNVILKFARCPE
jgi:hypothetical protein